MGKRQPDSEVQRLFRSETSLNRIARGPLFTSTKQIKNCIAFVWFAAVLIGSVIAQDKPPEKKITNPFAKDKGAVDAGRTQFNSGCAVCHGPMGQGGRGSRLADIERVQKMPDARMFEVIKEGVAGTQMPPIVFGR